MHFFQHCVYEFLEHVNTRLVRRHFIDQVVRSRQIKSGELHKISITCSTDCSANLDVTKKRGHLVADLREDSGLFKSAVDAGRAVQLVVACAEREQHVRVVGAHRLLSVGLHFLFYNRAPLVLKRLGVLLVESFVEAWVMLFNNWIRCVLDLW